MDLSLRSVVRRPAWQRYGGAGLLTVLVVAGRLALDPLWGRQHNRHLFFLPTVMVGAWIGGFGPGLLASGLCAFALSYLWMEPPHGLHASAELLLFLGVSVVICVLVQSLQVARDRADAARKSREQVLAVVAHDLRNPLTAIKMLTDILRRNAANAEVVGERTKAIDRATARMSDLIRDLVDAESMAHDQLTIRLNPENVQSIAREALDLQVPAAREHGLTLQPQLPEREILLLCDRHRILQVLANLLGNAIKFTPEGGRITLRVEDRRRAVFFAVDDTGPGIKIEHLPHLFERYWNTGSGGIGLGLFIARSIVRAHGGEIQVRTEPSQGTSFSFSLPRAETPAA